MTRLRLPLFACGLALAGAGVSLVPTLALAQAATLVPQDQRISDRAIQSDHATYEAVQARIKTLNDGGRRVADYHLAKAQCWLDVSLHEYTRNDRSAFPQAALGESDKLIGAMEAHAEPLPSETSLVNDAARLRPDLWDRAHSIKQGAGFACAAQKTACAEVELVHAGNEFNQQGWRHAKPYVQIAEDQMAEAEVQARQCAPAAAARVAMATPAPAGPLPVAVPAMAEMRVLLKADVVFAFDRSDRAAIRAGGLDRLDALLRRIVTEQLDIVSVRVIGHADRLNSTGDRQYNLRLSERRAKTVRDLLVGRSIAATAISVGAEGDTAQIDRCGDKTRDTPDLEECLLPNRRVEVALTAVRRP